MGAGRSCAFVVHWLVLLLMLTAQPSRVQAQTESHLRTDADEQGTSDPWLRLGEWERAQVEPILDRLGVRPDLSPFGKVVGRILVERLPVFGPDEPLPDGFNRLRVMTREQTVRDALTLDEGEEFTELGFRDAERQLRNPFIYSTVLVLPVESGTPGVVDLLVVTRDVWSLVPTWFFSVAGVLTEVHVGLVETNFLGRNDQLGVAFDWGQGYWQVGPSYSSPRVAGSRWTTAVSPTLVWDREVGEWEGYEVSASVSRPLYETRTPVAWDMLVQAGDRNGRRFVGGELQQWDDPDTVEVESVDERWRSRYGGIRLQGTRSYGVGLKHNITGGARAVVTDNEPLPREVWSPEVLQRFAEQRLPRSEWVVGPLAAYEVFENRWMTVRNLATFGIGEEVRLGGAGSLEARYSEPVLGSSVRFATLSAQVGWRIRLGSDGWVSGTVEQGARAEVSASGWQDVQTSGRLSLVSPQWRGVGRALLLARAVRIDRNGANTVLAMGADSGLRGFPVGYAQGDRQWLSSLEWRTPGARLLSTRLGGVFFVDHGSTWSADDEPAYHVSVGAGLRWMIPQLGPAVRSLDLGFPLTGGSRFRLGNTGLELPVPLLTLVSGQVATP